MVTKEAAYFETFGLSLWKVSSTLPVGRRAAQRLASPALNGSLLLCLLKQALSYEGFFLLRVFVQLLALSFELKNWTVRSNKTKEEVPFCITNMSHSSRTG